MKKTLSLLPFLPLITVFLIAHGCQSHPQKPNVEQLYQAGKYYRNYNKLDSAMHYFHRAESGINLHTEPILKGKIYVNIADLLQVQKNYRQAATYYQQALDAYHQAENPLLEAYTLLDMGDNQNLMCDTAPNELSYYRLALKMATDSALVGNAYQRIGLSYYHNRQHDSACHYLRKSLAYPYYGEEQSARLLFLGRSFKATKQLDSAKHYVMLALRFPTGVYQKSGCYTTLHKIALQEGDQASVAHYASLHALLSDSIASMENKLANELHDIKQAQTETLHTQKVRRNGWLAIAIGTLCIISGLFLLMHRKRNRQMKQARQAQAKLQQQLEQEQQRQESLQQLKDELTEKIKQEEVRAMERHRQECISHLREACTKAECYPTLSPRYKAALLSAYDQVLHWNDTKLFLTCIDRDFNRFAHRIETQYLKRRSSNHATARLCTLLLLDAPEEYIKALMPYTAETYHKAMTRLYKRFDTSDREELLVHLLYVLVEGM